MISENKTKASELKQKMEINSHNDIKQKQNDVVKHIKDFIDSDYDNLIQLKNILSNAESELEIINKYMAEFNKCVKNITKINNTNHLLRERLEYLKHMP